MLSFPCLSLIIRTKNYHSNMNFYQFQWFMLILIIPPFLLVVLKHKKQPKAKLPPTPKKLPLIGNLHQLFGDSPHLQLQKLSNVYGPIMLLQLGSIPTLVVSSKNIVQEIFKSHDLVFSSRPPLYSPKRLSYECNDISFAPYGEYWRQVRKITILEVFNTKRVQSFHQVRIEEVDFVIDSIVRCSPRPINLTQLMLSLANNVICRVVFGKKFDDDDMGNGEAKFYGILRETQQLLGEFNVADYFPWFGWLLNKVNGLDARLENIFKKLDEFYDEVIKEHLNPNRCRTNHEDLVDVLLRLQKDQYQAINLSDNQVKGILADMFVAGSDTSASTLVWAMTELIKNPLSMKKAQDEVRKVAKGKQRVEETDLAKLTYLQCVLKETFRLHPPVPLLVPRETTEDCTIRGYKIPAKTRVIINAYAIARDPNIWTEIDSDKFSPERFLSSSIDYRGQDFELIPFGFGRRGCPGVNFGVLLIELTLANLLFCFDWSLLEGMTRDDIEVVERIGLTTHKKNPLLLLATPVF